MARLGSWCKQLRVLAKVLADNKQRNCFAEKGKGGACFRLSLARQGSYIGGTRLSREQLPQGFPDVATACWPQSLRAVFGRRAPEEEDSPGRHRPRGLVTELHLTFERLAPDMWGERGPGARIAPSSLLLFPFFPSLQKRGFQRQSSFRKVYIGEGGERERVGECGCLTTIETQFCP